MISAPKHDEEDERLNRLREYNVLDTESEASLDELTKLASEICHTPISLISLVDADRQWFKSKVGLDADETSRDIAFCSHAILQSNIFEVPDAKNDIRFHDNPLVIGNPDIRFYAGFPLKSPDGLPIGTLCVIDTEPKKLDQNQKNALEILSKQVISQLELRQKTAQLQRANKFKTEFLSNMSHEIRTPLNAIIGFSDVLINNQNEYLKTSDAIQFVRNIDFSGKHLLSMINTVLDLSKIEAGKMTTKPTEFNLKLLIDNVTDMLGMKASDQGVSLATKYSIDDSFKVYLDGPKLSQIIINLVNNSIKFSDAHTKISIHVSSEGSNLILIVEDQGIGISETEIVKIFDKYHQVENGDIQGTGLGLNITKNLVELMGGTISVESTLDEGTVFTVELPLRIPEDLIDKDVIGNESLTLPAELKILIVEDNKINQTLIKALFKHLGYSPLVVDNGESSIQAIGNAEEDFDLVLMDINLPGISGFEATRAIKRLKPRMKVAALSADVFADPEYDELFDKRLTKPITLESLELALFAMLGVDQS
jgi:signal transduction histidine kinase